MMTQSATAFDGIGYVIFGHKGNVKVLIDGEEIASFKTFGHARKVSQDEVSERARAIGLGASLLRWDTKSM